MAVLASLGVYGQRYAAYGRRALRPVYRMRLEQGLCAAAEQQRWLQSETLPLFAFSVLPELSLNEKVSFVTGEMSASSAAAAASLAG